MDDRAGLARDAVACLFQQRDEGLAAGLRLGKFDRRFDLRQHGAGGELAFGDVLSGLFRRQLIEAAKLEVKNSIILWPLRVAVSGKASTPGGATEICALLGKQESIDRVIRGIELLGK